MLITGKVGGWKKEIPSWVTFQVRVQVPDDIVCQLPDKWQLVAAAQRGELERPEAHKGWRHTAHHRAGLIRCVSAAQAPLSCLERDSHPSHSRLMLALQSLLHSFMRAGPHWLLQKLGHSIPAKWNGDGLLCRR